MSEPTVRLADWQEDQIADAIGMAVRGGAILVVCLLIIWILHLSLTGSSMIFAGTALGIAAFIGGVFMISSLYRLGKVKARKSIPFRCPYCEGVNQLLAKPVTNFDCEHCRRQIHFENGSFAPLKTAVCSSCSAEHKVWVGAEKMVCDRCNNVMQLKQADVNNEFIPKVPSTFPGGMLLGGPNQSVSIIGCDASRTDQLSLLLQREMKGTTASELRTMLQSVSAVAPLVVAYDIPIGEADNLAENLRQLGAKLRLEEVH